MLFLFPIPQKLTTLNKNTPHLTNLPHNQQNNDTNNLQQANPFY